jgi:hypothetical protein
MSDRHELEQRQQELTARLAELRTHRDQAFRVNSDALALQRAGVTHHNESEMSAFATDEVSGDAAISELRRELALVESELAQSSGTFGGMTRKLFGRMRRA